MEKIVYYFIFENEFMNDLIDGLCRIWRIDEKYSSKLLSDGREDMYILDAGKKGISYVGSAVSSYVYEIYIFTSKQYEKEIKEILEDLATEIREDYGEDRRRFINPIQNDSKFVKRYTDTINKFNERELFKEYL